jgi:hypothetical protein
MNDATARTMTLAEARRILREAEGDPKPDEDLEDDADPSQGEGDGDGSSEPADVDPEEVLAALQQAVQDGTANETTHQLMQRIQETGDKLSDLSDELDRHVSAACDHLDQLEPAQDDPAPEPAADGKPGASSCDMEMNANRPAGA